MGFRGQSWVFQVLYGQPTPERMLENLDYSEYPIEIASFKPMRAAATIIPRSIPPEDHGRPQPDSGNIDKIVVDTCSMAIRAVVEPGPISKDRPNVAAASSACRTRLPARRFSVTCLCPSLRRRS
jgi:2-methylcitrate dehydratase PrpD